MVVILSSTAFANDKLVHFCAGIAISILADAFGFENPLLFTALVGVAKETHDYFQDKHSAEFMDIVATVIGAKLVSIVW